MARTIGASANPRRPASYDANPGAGSVPPAQIVAASVALFAAGGRGLRTRSRAAHCAISLARRAGPSAEKSVLDAKRGRFWGGGRHADPAMRRPREELAAT